jgi:hypothetical protein
MSLIICAKVLLVNDELYFASLAGQMTEEQIRHTLEINREWSWLGYLLIPVLLFLKFILVAAILATGYYVLANRWEFNPFFRTAIIAEFVMLVPIIIKIIWFSLLHPAYSLADLQEFSPLSLSSLVKPAEVESWLRYPLQVASLFEVAYWLLIIVGVQQLVGLSWGRATRLVVLSYGPALLIWVLLVMFVIVSAS